MTADSGPRRIWVVKVSEPLPLLGSATRLMRAGLIAQRLMETGADVTWWVSDFSHLHKRREDLEGVVDAERSGRLSNGVRAQFLHGRAYARNVSFARLANHREEARDFAQRARALPAPHAIFCCMPTIDLALEATRFGKERGIPVIVDIRDLWPDVFVDVAPTPAWLTRLAIQPLDRRVRHALSQATGITAISPPILDWALAKAGRARGPHDLVVPLAYQPAPLLPQALGAEESVWRGHGLKLDGSERIACFFGNLSNFPELETAVDALDFLPDGLRATTKFVICGAGERLDWLRAKAPSRSELVAPGHVSGAALATLMRHSTAGLLIYPSRSDILMSYPNKVGEYLAGGLPVISTVDGIVGPALRAGGCGTVVPNRDPKALAEAFAAYALDDAGRDRRKAAAHALFQTLFDADTVYGGLSDFLVELSTSARPS